MRTVATFLVSVSLVASQCLAPVGPVDLYVVFDLANHLISEYRDDWADAIRRFGKWVYDDYDFKGSYSRVSDISQDLCWVEDARQVSYLSLATAVENGRSLLTPSVPDELSLDMIGAWLYQGLWKEAENVRRILFIATGNSITHLHGDYVRISQDGLANPTKLCPITHMVSESQNAWSIRKMNSGVLVASFPYVYDDNWITIAVNDYFKRFNISDSMVISRQTLGFQVPSVTLNALKLMTCETWTATTTPLPKCWGKEEVVECFHSAWRTSPPQVWKYNLFHQCVLPSCFDWDTAYSCVQQFDPTTSCNWADDLFECIDP